MKTRPSARHAYVTAEVVTGLAMQIRSIRIDRGWSQGELARKLGTTQAAISRLEDAAYGRATLKTLLQLAAVFDAGLEVRFTSLITMLSNTFVPSEDRNYVPAFEDEATNVSFYTKSTDWQTTSPKLGAVTLQAFTIDLRPSTVTVPAAPTITLPTSETFTEHWGAKRYA